MKQEIDKLISSLYIDQEYGELEALSKLISQKFTCGLEAILNKKNRDNQYFKQIHKVSIGWIDKIPVAEFVNQTKDLNNFTIKEKVEIGDILFIHSDRDLTNNRKRYQASIIQAKLGSVNSEIPIGTLNPNNFNSTSKEFALLSTWPNFNLYKTARSSYAEEKNLNISDNNSASKFMAFYDNQWKGNNPTFQAPCSMTLGEHIEKLVKFCDGKSFEYNSEDEDWDRLINTIIRLCNHYTLPNKHYGSNTDPRMIGGITNFLTIKDLKDIQESADYEIFKGDEQKFPILVIERFKIEGRDEINKYFR